MNENTNRRNFFKSTGTEAAAALGLSIVKPQSVRGAQANSALWQGYKPYNAKRRGDLPVEVPTRYDITADAVSAFVDGARTSKIENAAFTAAESTMTAIMAREAIYSGTEMTWDKISNA
jgi:hypothetical protein